jgi:hypothetical protein
MEIAELMVKRQHYEFDDAARAAFQEYLKLRMPQPHFANARSVRNALDRVKSRHANRLMAARGLVSKDDLARLDAADILQSRVFQGGIEGVGDE